MVFLNKYTFSNKAMKKNKIFRNKKKILHGKNCMKFIKKNWIKIIFFNQTRHVHLVHNLIKLVNKL